MESTEFERRGPVALPDIGHTGLVRHAIATQRRLGSVCAVEQLQAGGVPAEVILRVLSERKIRSDDRT